MTSTAALTGSHLRTYKTLFQHPLSHNLAWHDVDALLSHLGQVEVQANGNRKATRNGQCLVLHPTRTKEVAETDELMALRHFLERSETVPLVSGGDEARVLLVIDHQEARLFRTLMSGGIPERILPHNPDEYSQPERNSENLSRGKERPNPNSFFEPVAKALQGAGQILIFGTGTGTSSEMAQFVGWIKVHHAELVDRIIGGVVVDEHHLTESQLLAKARDWYAIERRSQP